MPKMRSLLRSKPKVDEEEFLTQARMAARFASLFGTDAVARAEEAAAAETSPEQVADPDGTGADATSPERPAVLAPWPGGPRPPIEVKVDTSPEDLETGPRVVEPIGVMAQPGEDIGGDDWQLPQDDGAELEPAAADTDVAITADVEAVAAADTDLAITADVEAVAAADTDVPFAADLEPVADAEPPSSTPTPAPTHPPKRRASTARPAAAKARRPAATRGTKSKTRSKPAPPASCPYCAALLAPPPTMSRRCEKCRQRIVVKRIEGRAVYLTEAAVLVFEAERRRIASAGRLTRERTRWLQLAEAAGEAGPRAMRLAGAQPSEDVVSAARALYVATVDRAFKAARRDQEWETASRIRRDQATALYRIAHAPLPPPADLVALYREGVLAELRGIAKLSREAELVSGACCDGCRADDRQVFRIAHELREPRLPHAGCPRGLCRCHWDLAARDRTTMRRLLRRRPRTESRAARSDPAPTD